MKKKVLAALMAMLMVVGLAGCGDDASANQSSVPSETRPTESIVVEESRPEESEAEETEESQEIVENSVGGDDEEISGLIIATLLTDVRSGTCEITCFDPDNGTARTISNFRYQTDSEAAYFFATSDKLFSGSYRFDESYTKMAAVKIINSNNETHAGWLSSDGSFFDITEAVGMAPNGDFANPVKHISMGFTDNGYFVFCDSSKPLAAKYYSVPLSNVSPGAIVEEYTMPYSTCDTSYSDRLSSYDFPSDWIDATHCIVTSLETNPTTSLIFDGGSNSRTEYIPGNSRVNWNGRLSPDGTKIAFTSVPINGSESPDIFITSVDGGEPTRVADHDFTLTYIDDDFGLKNIPYNTRSCILLDWR